jgi:hypothetical protein
MILAGRIPSGPEPPPRFRVIRVEGIHGLVAVEHTEVERARRAWNSTSGDAPGPGVRTLRSFGTLRKGKAWLASRPRS